MTDRPTDDPVATARTADRVAWSNDESRSRREALLIRDSAVRRALADGVPEQEIAAALGVRTSDIKRMAREPLPA